MALLKRELHRQVNGPEITDEDRSALIFNTDTKRLYVEYERAHCEVRIEGAIEFKSGEMDIAEYLKQGGQTAGHRELWRLIRTLFEETPAVHEDEVSPRVAN